MAKQEFHIPITSEDKTAVDWLAETSGISRQKLKQYMHQGCVWLERVKADVSEIDPLVEINKASHQGYIQRLRRAKKVLNANEILHFYFDESILLNEVTPPVLVEDLGDYSIWNKSSGMLSQGSKWGDHCTINRWAEKNLHPERPAFIVHRLDRAATGLIILAHKKSVASQFARMFEGHQIEKHYKVEVEGDFSTMIPADEKVQTINETIDGKTAISHVTMQSFNSVKKTSILEVQIETGRKHQIRKHLLKVGFPVVGDRLYGLKSSSNENKQEVDLQLQAKSLKFICPISSTEKHFTL